MVFIIGASCLANAIKVAPEALRSQVQPILFARKGLSLNPNAKNKRTNLELLLNRGPLKNKKNLIRWHGVISNSITRQISNNYSALPVSSLVELLRRFSDRISAIVYCQRLGSPNILEELRKLDILVIDAGKKLLSKRRQRSGWYRKQLSLVHPDSAIELGLLTRVLQRRNNLKSIVLRNRTSGRKRPSQKRSERKTKRKRPSKNKNKKKRNKSTGTK